MYSATHESVPVGGDRKSRLQKNPIRLQGSLHYPLIKEESGKEGMMYSATQESVLVSGDKKNRLHKNPIRLQVRDSTL